MILQRFIILCWLMSLSMWYIGCQTTDSMVEKYMDYQYHELNMSQEQREKNPLLAGAMDYYVTKDYALAIGKLQEQINLHNADGVSYFYIGLSQMYLGQYKEAIGAFEQGITADPELYDYTSHWYMALCCIKLGQNDKARPHLQYILDHDPDKPLYKENARILLEKL